MHLYLLSILTYCPKFSSPFFLPLYVETKKKASLLRLSFTLDDTTVKISLIDSNTLFEIYNKSKCV